MAQKQFATPRLLKHILGVDTREIHMNLQFFVKYSHFLLISILGHPKGVSARYGRSLPLSHPGPRSILGNVAFAELN